MFIVFKAVVLGLLLLYTAAVGAAIFLGILNWFLKKFFDFE